MLVHQIEDAGDAFVVAVRKKGIGRQVGDATFDLVRDHTAGLTAFGLALGLTTIAAAGLDAIALHASRAVELGVLVIANLVATVGRFVLLRTWVGRTADAAAQSATPRTDLEGIPS